MRAFGKFLSGFFWGAVVGGLAALLLSPNSGADNQKKIQEYILMVQEETRKAGDEKGEEMRTQLEKLRTGE